MAVKHFNPPQLIVISFMVAIIFGSMVLMLPAAVNGPPLRFIDALFTSASAVCVTGLVVVDTGTRFTLFGQLTILALIQLGGLGIMTFSVVFVLLLGRKLAFREKLLISDAFSHLPVNDIRYLVRQILLFTVAIEGCGAVILFCCWLPDFSWPHAGYLAVFHAISAFCNAGFSLFSDSLTSYRHDIFVNLTVMVLIIAGGLGFLVIMEIPYVVRQRLRHQRVRLTLHSKLVLLVTVLLIVGGTCLLFLTEQVHTLSELSPGRGLLAAAFQAVSARTAGFNTLDIGSFGNPSLLIVILLMFVGASPGSCGGGVKTTAFGVFLLMCWSRFAGRDTVNLFGRTFPPSTIVDALTIIITASLVLIVFLLALSISEAQLHLPLAVEHGRFLHLLFEEVSAFATVGLSTGVTPTLTDPGKFLLVLLMFTGRVGPLTAVLVWARRRPHGRYQYAEEQVMIG
ncbi:MAG: potassium transporter [Deltaproteobacteria bacterium]|nr:potassium transporter [Candidatus Anaeroferrophillus wilburensis]MBN2889871.1 potassium transporter [Deltaproteobacteria bacterium]